MASSVILWACYWSKAIQILKKYGVKIYEVYEVYIHFNAHHLYCCLLLLNKPFIKMDRIS